LPQKAVCLVRQLWNFGQAETLPAQLQNCSKFRMTEKHRDGCPGPTTLKRVGKFEMVTRNRKEGRTLNPSRHAIPNRFKPFFHF
jgi:hypothetical protein